MTALAANVRHLELDPVWIQFLRRPVLGTTMAASLRYCLLYHSSNPSNPTVGCRPHTLSERFHVDAKRFDYALLQHFARVGEWAAFEAHTRPVKTTLSLFPSAGGGRSAGQQQHVYPTLIGYGAILDHTVHSNAPGKLVANYDALFGRQEAKSSSIVSRRPHSLAPSIVLTLRSTTKLHHRWSDSFSCHASPTSVA